MPSLLLLGTAQKRGISAAHNQQFVRSIVLFLHGGKKSLRIPFILKGLILTFLRTVLPIVINSPSPSHWKKCIEHKVKEHNVMAISPGLQDFKHCFTALPSMPKNEVYCAPFIMVFCKNYNGWVVKQVNKNQTTLWLNVM